MSLTSFQNLELSEKMLKSLAALGYAGTTPVQGEAIPVLMKKLDVLVQAPTGTGKTCAFGIPIIEHVDTDSNDIQYLVLCPTRELVLQTTVVLRQLTKFSAGIKIAPIYGGERIDKQFIALRRKPHIIVGTPGRMMDFLHRKALKLENVQGVVLDEADRMLDMGFREELDEILNATPSTRQTILFSATMSPDVARIAQNYQREPVAITIKQETATVDSVTQYSILVKPRCKIPTLLKLLRERQFPLTLVFAGTKAMTDTISEQLIAAGIRASALHGDLRQRRRDFVMNEYRTGLIDVLVATDVAARGIDVNNIDAVINFDLPQCAEDYVHRVGRTGRAQKSGLAFTFIYPREQDKLQDYIKETKADITPIRIEVPQPLQAFGNGMVRNPSHARLDVRRDTRDFGDSGAKRGEHRVRGDGAIKRNPSRAQFDGSAPKRSRASFDAPSPRRISNRELVDESPNRGAGRSFGDNAPRQNAGRSFGDGAPRQNAGRSFGDNAPRQNAGRSFGDGAPRQNAGRSFGDGAPRQNAGRSFGDSAPRQNAGRSFGDGAPRQSAGRSFGDGAPNQSAGRSFGDGAPSQSAGRSFGDSTAPKRNAGRPRVEGNTPKRNPNSTWGRPSDAGQPRPVAGKGRFSSRPRAKGTNPSTH